MSGGGLSTAPRLRFAFFDDYADERGHHPDLIIGLGVAAGAELYCPESFVDGGVPPGIASHHSTIGVTGSCEATRANLKRSYDDAQARGSEVFVNLFLDENWDSLRIARSGLPMVQVLHRPAEVTGALGGVNAGKPGDAVRVIAELACTDPLVVHTRHGERQARDMFPSASILYLGWPAARQEDISARFTAAGATASWTRDEEPYVLLVGEALKYKGIELLLHAVSPGPALKIAGYPTFGGPDWIARSFPDARVSWEPSWVTRERMTELIGGAAAVVFPYLPEFAEHGGVSGALVQALTFAKPIVVSDALAGQIPDIESCLLVPPKDLDALREAITTAVERRDELTAAALTLREYVLREHSYEGHIAHLTDWLTSLE